MQQDLVDLFFLELSKDMPAPADVIVTGAAAGTLLGNVRASRDVDFEIRLKQKNDAAIARLDALIKEIASRVGVETDYSEDINHWSMIDLLDYRDKAVPYKKIGKLDIRLMAPEYWTIGKMARYIEPDITDIIQMIKKKNLDSDDLISLWARALKASPLSLAKRQFIEHAKNFIKEHSQKAWGKSFNPVSALKKFDKAIQT